MAIVRCPACSTVNDPEKWNWHNCVKCGKALTDQAPPLNAPSAAASSAVASSRSSSTSSSMPTNSTAPPTKTKAKNRPGTLPGAIVGAVIFAVATQGPLRNMGLLIQFAIGVPIFFVCIYGGIFLAGAFSGRSDSP